MRSVIIKLADNEEFATMPAPIQAQIMSYNAQWVRIGKSANGYYIVDAIVTDDFDPAVLASFGLTWDILGLWEWDGQPDEVTITDEPPVEYAADQVTDDEFDVPRQFSRHFARQLFDVVGEEAVPTAVQCLDDYGNVVAEVPGATLDSDGGYTLVTKRPAKLVAGFGKVDPSELNQDGSYTHRPQTITRTPRIKTLMPLQAQKYRDHMPDNAQGQRPTVATEMLRWSGWPTRF